MQKDFKIGQSNELIKEGSLFDIHNHYKFASIILKENGRLLVAFEPTVEHSKDGLSVLLEFETVNFLEFNLQFAKKDDAIVDEFGYKSVGDMDDNWLLTEAQATKDDHFFIRFFGGGFIRVQSEKARLHVGAN